jgi:hypothetical protein
MADTTDLPYPQPQDIYVNSSSRMIRRPESPLLQAYGGSNPPGTHIVGGVVTSLNLPKKDGKK